MEHAREIIRNRGGTIRTGEALRAGIHRRTFYAMRDDGQLEEQARGVYSLVDVDHPADPDLTLIAKRIPHGVICLVSALAIHELTTQIPHVVHLAIPRKARYPTLPEVVMSVYRYAQASYESGMVQIKHNGMSLLVYNADKSIADCFKYRNKIGLDIFLEALKTRRRQRDWSPQDILEYARINRVGKQITPYLETIL